MAGRFRRSGSAGSTSPTPMGPSGKQSSLHRSSETSHEAPPLRWSPSETFWSHPEFQRPSFSPFHVIAHLYLFQDFANYDGLITRQTGRHISIRSHLPGHGDRLRLHRVIGKHIDYLAIGPILNSIPGNNIELFSGLRR